MEGVTNLDETHLSEICAAFVPNHVGLESQPGTSGSRSLTVVAEADRNTTLSYDPIISRSIDSIAFNLPVWESASGRFIFSQNNPNAIKV